MSEKESLHKEVREWALAMKARGMFFAGAKPKGSGEAYYFSLMGKAAEVSGLCFEGLERGMLGADEWFLTDDGAEVTADDPRAVLRVVKIKKRERKS